MKKILFAFIAALTLSSCYEECEDCNFGEVIPRKVDRVYFHYMAMDNGLYRFADQNIDGMVEGVTAESLNGGIIYVFRDMPGEPSQLIAIYWDENRREARKNIVKTYEADLDSSLPETLKRAIRDVDALVDAGSWTLGFGSHGLGWIPWSTYPKYGKNKTFRSGYAAHSTRSLIDDHEKNRMEIADFVDALTEAKPAEAGPKYDLVLMDLCFMGCVEFAYQMKDIADYLILSPAEVVDKGFPYNQIMNDIFASDIKAGAQTICEEFYQFYDNFYNTAYQFATVALVDCGKFTPFVNVMKDVVTANRAKIDALKISDLTPWCFDRFINHITFDMRKFVEELGGHPDFDEALSGLIPFCATTGKRMTDIPSIIIPKENFSGISTYIPVPQYADLNEAYFATDWAKAIYQ